MAVTRDEVPSVGFFEQLYAIVVGLGLAVAIEQIVDLDRDGIPVAFEHVPVFLAYLNIVFAFAHASVRYLELAYVHRGLGSLSKPRVVADLTLGVGQFLWLLGLSFVITRPMVFAFTAIILLIGRPARDALILATGGVRLEFDKKVANVYLVTVGFLAVALVVTLLLEGDSETWFMRIATLVASLGFGLGLYLFAFDSFFPQRAEGRVVDSP